MKPLFPLSLSLCFLKDQIRSDQIRSDQRILSTKPLVVFVELNSAAKV